MREQKKLLTVFSIVGEPLENNKIKVWLETEVILALQK